MTRFVSAAMANRQFSEFLGEAARGETIIITRRGEPVAQLSPIIATAEQKARGEALERLIATMREGFPSTDEPFDRDSLYDRHR